MKRRLRAAVLAGALLVPVSTVRADDQPIDDLVEFLAGLFSGSDRDRRLGDGFDSTNTDPNSGSPNSGNPSSGNPGPGSPDPGDSAQQPDTGDGDGSKGSIAGVSSVPDHVYAVPPTPFELSTHLNATDPTMFLFTLPPAYGFEIDILAGPAIESLTIYDPLSSIVDSYLIESGLDSWYAEEGKLSLFPSGASSFRLFHTKSAWTDFAILMRLEAGYEGPVDVRVRTLNLDPQPVPEPTTIALFAVSLGGLGFARRRRQRAE